MIDRTKDTVRIFEDPNCAGSWAIEDEIIESSGMIVVKRKGSIQTGFEVIPPDTVARISLMIDGTEDIIGVFQDPKRASSRTIESDMVKLSTVVVIEGESAIGGGLQVVSSDAVPRIAPCDNSRTAGRHAKRSAKTVSRERIRDRANTASATANSECSTTTPSKPPNSWSTSCREIDLRA